MSKPELKFSRLGDALFARLASRLGGRRRRLLAEQPLGPAQLQSIRRAAARYLSACLGGAPEEPAALLAALEARRRHLPNYSQDELLLPPAPEARELSLLQRSLSAAFAALVLDELIAELEPAINLRLIFGDGDPWRMRQPSSPTRLHSEVWSGLPVDSVLVSLPLFGDIERLGPELGELPPAQELAAMRRLSSYEEGARYPLQSPYSDLRLRPGVLYFADARLLRRIVRRARAGVAVFLDFRFRLAGSEAYLALAHPSARGEREGWIPYRRWLGVGADSFLRLVDGRSSPPRYHLEEALSRAAG